jgi:hypothetical protein
VQSSIGRAISLYAFTVLGIFLIVAPWTPVWEQAILALVPAAATWMMSGWVRGVVSGVGALDLVVALQVGAELWKGMRSDPGE